MTRQAGISQPHQLDIFSHQTGWTGVIAKLIQQQGERAERAGEPSGAQEVRAA